MIGNKFILLTAGALFTISCAPKETPKSQILNSYGVQQVFSELSEWFNEGEGTEGSRVDWVYENYPEVKNGEKVIVAVIDSGVDYDHEDLQGKIWVNTAEIPNNGIDDDENGYVDDIYGWNYLTNKDGSTLSRTTLEVTRELSRIETKEQNEGLSPSEQQYKEELEKSYNAQVAKRKNGIRSLKSEKSYYLSVLKSLDLKASDADVSTISALDLSLTATPILLFFRRFLYINIFEFSPTDIPLSFEPIIDENSTSAVLSIKSIASLLGSINFEFLIIILFEISTNCSIDSCSGLCLKSTKHLLWSISSDEREFLNIFLL